MCSSRAQNYAAANTAYGRLVRVLRRVLPPDRLHAVLQHIRRQGNRGRIGINAQGDPVVLGYRGKSLKKIPFGQLFDFLDIPPRWWQLVKRHILTSTIVANYTDGEDIHRVFEQYRPGSCMRYPHCRPLREIYAENPDDCGVIYCKYLPTTRGGCSALVWHGSKYTYIDRVYKSNNDDDGVITDLLIQFLRQRFGRPVKSVYHGDADATFRLNRPSSGVLPYGDSLYYFRTTSDGRMIWSTTNCKGDKLEAQCQYGVTIDGTYLEECRACEGITLDGQCLNEDCCGDTVWSDYLGESIPERDAIELRIDQGGGTWEWDNVYRDDNDLVECDRCYNHSSRLTDTDDGESICSCCMEDAHVTEDGEIYYHDEHVITIDRHHDEIAYMLDHTEYDSRFMLGGVYVAESVREYIEELKSMTVEA